MYILLHKYNIFYHINKAKINPLQHIPEDSPAMKATPKHDTSVLLLFFILTTVVDVTLAIV